MVPRPLLQSSEPPQFLESRGRSFNKSNFTGFRLNHEQIVNQNQLPVSVSATFPAAGARRQIDARQNPLIKSVNETVAHNNARKLGPEIRVRPTQTDVELIRR